MQCFNSSPRQNHKQLRLAGKLTPKIYKQPPTEKIDSKIVIIRDPIERLFSVYYDRVVLRNMNDSNDTIQSWEDFVYNLQYYRRQFADVAQHSRKQVEYFLEKNIDSYDKVYKTADITKHVRKHIGRIAEVKIQARHRKNRQSGLIEYNRHQSDVQQRNMTGSVNEEQALSDLMYSRELRNQINEMKGTSFVTKEGATITAGRKDPEIIKVIQEHYADDYDYFENHL